MNEHSRKIQAKQRCWVGLDWGGENHAVSIVDEKRTVLEQFKVDASLEGLSQLVERLQAWGSVAGVAIEATRNPVVGYLYEAGFTVYLINPRLQHPRLNGGIGCGQAY